MNTTQREQIMQRWNVIQRELLPELHNEVGPLTPKLETVIYTLEWVRIEEFAEAQLPERVHEALVKSHLGDALIGHINRDGTAIEARERPARAQTTAPAHAHKRGRPRRGEIRPAAKVSPIHTQRQQSLARMLKDIPAACDRGTKCNAQGYQVSWNGYKLHLDTADCGVPIAALLSSASMHDSRAAIPLSLMSADRVTSLYDLMDAATAALNCENTAVVWATFP